MIGFFTYLMFISIILGLAGIIADTLEYRIEAKKERLAKAKNMHQKKVKPQNIRYTKQYVMRSSSVRVRKCA